MNYELMKKENNMENKFLARINSSPVLSFHPHTHFDDHTVWSLFMNLCFIFGHSDGQQLTSIDGRKMEYH